MAEAKVHLTRPGDLSKVDQSKVRRGKKPTPTDAVEGQMAYLSGAVCWQCWSINDVLVDPSGSRGYFCWNCGTYFEV